MKCPFSASWVVLCSCKIASCSFRKIQLYFECMKRAAMLGAGKVFLVLRELDPSGLSVKRAKCLQSHRYFFKEKSFIWLSSSASPSLSLSLNKLYFWERHLDLWCQSRHHWQIWQMIYIPCYSTTAGVQRICFSDCPDLGLSNGTHLTDPSLCSNSQVLYSICPQALLPLLMGFQQSSEGPFVMLWGRICKRFSWSPSEKATHQLSASNSIISG